MIPVYFPFTSLSPAARAALSAGFPTVAAYAPSPGLVHPSLSGAADDGIVEVRTPVSEDEERLAAIVAEFQEWGELRGGADLGAFKRSEMEAPLLEEASAESLRSAIRKRVQGTSGPSGPAPLFQARIFLALAQRFDGYQGELDAELAATGELERVLAEGLHGDASVGIGGGFSGAATDLGARMTGTRLAAWSRLFSEAPAAAPLVTDSPAVWEAVRSAAGDPPVRVEIPEIPLRPADPTTWHDRVALALAGHPDETAPPVVAGPAVGLRAIRVSGIPVAALLRRAAAGAEGVPTATEEAVVDVILLCAV